MGALTAPVYPAASRVVANWLPLWQRAGANGLIQGAAAVGISCAFPLFGALIDGFDWPIAFLVCGALTSLVAAAWIIGSRPASDRPGFSSPGAGISLSGLVPVLRRRSVVCLTLSYTAYNYFQYLFFYWIQYYFEAMQQVGRGESRRYSMTITLAMGAGMVAGGWLADRVPRSLPARTRRAAVCGPQSRHRLPGRRESWSRSACEPSWLSRPDFEMSRRPV